MTIYLQVHREKLAPVDAFPQIPGQLLYHQVRTVEALCQKSLVVNTYATGTGKTRASLLYLFDPQGLSKNVLFIAPTNALIRQHVEDIQGFVAEHKLDFKVQEVNAALLRGIQREFSPDQGKLRVGETLQRLIQNYLEFSPIETRRQPLILVVNPDIFYYALYFQYQAHDQRNVFERFLLAFNYIVIDEFHYYDSKQLASFLFAFALWDQFGYFEHGRKVCLLSATPTPQVLTYLDRVFGERWTLISPRNEPPASVGYETVQTLTELELEIADDEFQEWVRTHRGDLAHWLAAGQDGALISSSLWRVNEAFDWVRSLEARRITGPEPTEKRVEAVASHLILATPTVDIGYNFEKFGKPRQNVDFLVCDARFHDELVQRLGRVGRVLGKSVKDQPSRATVLLTSEAAQELRVYDGQTFSRHAFADLLTNLIALPPKHSLTAYIRSHAITECFYPIYQLGQLLSPELQDEVDALYQRVVEVFAPGSQRSQKSLAVYFKKYWKRRKWLNDTKQGQLPLNRDTAQHVADWIEWLDPQRGQLDTSVLVPRLAQLLRDEPQRRDLREFVASQVSLTKSLFSFRDSFQGPTTVVYDSERLLSSETINSYDLLHLVAYYSLGFFDSRAAFVREVEETDLTGDFYARLLRRREPKLSVELSFRSQWSRPEFEAKLCRCVVALSGLRLVTRERGGDVKPVPGFPYAALEAQHVPILIVAPEDSGVLISRLRGTPIYSRRLTVDFPSGASQEYRALLGTGAWLAHAELRGHFQMRERLKMDCILV